MQESTAPKKWYFAAAAVLECTEQLGGGGVRVHHIILYSFKMSSSLPLEYNNIINSLYPLRMLIGNQVHVVVVTAREGKCKLAEEASRLIGLFRNK